MLELPELLRVLTRKLQLAFDRQWSSVWGLRTLKRANRIVWGTRGPLELEGVERVSLGAAAVLARHDSHLRLPSLRELNPELARIFAQHRHDLYLDGCRSLDALTATAIAKHGLETVRMSDMLAPWQLPPGRGFTKPSDLGYERPIGVCGEGSGCQACGPHHGLGLLWPWCSF